MEELKISVIIPVYNIEKYISRCLDSVVAQTYNNLQIIVVDDGSADGSGAICDAYAAKDDRITVIHKANGGLSSARNAGMAVADGDYIAFLDGDDWVSGYMYGYLLSLAVEYGADIAEGTFAVAFDAEPIKDTEEPTVTVCNAEQAMKLHLLNERFRQVVWNKLYKASLIKTELFAETVAVSEDEYWTYNVIGKCNVAVTSSKCVYYYFQREGSIIHSRFNVKRLEGLDAVGERINYVKEKFPALTDLAIGSYLGLCFYNYQCLNRTPDVDADKTYRKKMIKSARLYNSWLSKRLTGKSSLWLRAFLRFPNAICKLRNLLKIGL